MKAFCLRAAIAFLLIAAALFFSAAVDPGGVAVLNYHQINEREGNSLIISPEQFTAQMDWLADEGYHTITCAELAAAIESGAPLPPNPVLITFDDGYVDNYENAYPVLRERNMKATVFLISDFAGEDGYLTWKQISEMQSGGIEFGSHTKDHGVLTELSDFMVSQELRISKSVLEMRLGRPVSFLAYPCGYTDERVSRLVREAGYRGAFTVDLGRDYRGDDMLSLHRIPIFGGNDHTMLRFKMRIKCPRLAAALERVQKRLVADGWPYLAQWIPVI